MKQLEFAPILVLTALLGCAHAPETAPTREEPHDPPPPVVETVQSEPAREAEAPPVVALPPAAPIDLPIARPCEAIVTRVDGSADVACVEVERVQPESIPLSVCAANPSTLTFRFDAQGRIVEGPGSTYAYRSNGTATRTTAAGRVALTFDAEHRITRAGATRQTYDEHGLLARVDSGRHFLQYVRAPDGTYTTTHNHPDSDEFCVSDLVEVGRDATGHVAFDRYDGCQINYAPYTLRYHYDDSGALDGIEVDVDSDGSIEARVALRYSC